MKNKKNYTKEAGNIHLSYYIEAADKLNIKYEILVHKLLAKFTYQNKHWYILNTVTPLINSPGKTICSRKNLTNIILKNENIPTTIQKEIQNEKEAIEFFKEHKEIVLKPKENLGGIGVNIKPKNKKEVKIAFRDAIKNEKSKNKETILVEKFFKGENYRLLTLDKKVIGVIKRHKPSITGDGKRKIKEILKETNIPIDRETKKNLKEQKYNLNTILKENEKIYVRHNTNLTQGSITEEYSKYMHPYYEEIATKVLVALNIKFGGVDIITEDITKPSNFVINEVNYNPGIRLHYQVQKGERKEVAVEIMKYILENN